MLSTIERQGFSRPFSMVGGLNANGCTGRAESEGFEWWEQNDAKLAYFLRSRNESNLQRHLIPRILEFSTTTALEHSKSGMRTCNPIPSPDARSEPSPQRCSAQNRRSLATALPPTINTPREDTWGYRTPLRFYYGNS
jgi:hypothetical protein